MDAKETTLLIETPESSKLNGYNSNHNKEWDQQVLQFPQENGQGKNKESDQQTNLTIFKASRKSKFVLFLCTFANFLSGCSFSMIAPFYPQEAAMKGMSDFMVGMVFSIYQFNVFIFSPLIGTYLATIGPKFTHLSSIFVGGMTSVLLGTLDKCPPGVYFIVISFICRSLQAIAFSGFIIASFAITSIEFTDCVVTAFGIIETGTMVGYMIGPVIGGALYDLGGYGLPFYVIGAAVVFSGIVIYKFLPKPKQMDTKRRKTTISLVKTPMVLIPMISICLGATSVLFLEPTLAQHMSPFGMSSVVTGLFFFIKPFFCCLWGPILGHLSDAKNLQASVIITGHVMLVVGYFILGPVYSFIPLTPWTVAISLVIIGSAFECTLIPTMKCMVIGALESGFEDNIDTYGIVAGLLNGAYFLGGTIGPLIGGATSFVTGSRILCVLNTFVIIVCCIFFFYRRTRSGKTSKT